MVPNLTRHVTDPSTASTTALGIVVVPLFVQRSRPPRGSRFAIPLQFSADAVTAGARGVAYCDNHIAVGYLNALQTLCHHAGAADEGALPQWLGVLGHLLQDLEAYMDLLPDVAALVEHLRASEAAPDMLQRALSFAASRKPFSPEERLRLLETVLKRTFKLHESLLGTEAVRRIVSTLVLVPLLYGVHRGVLPAAAAATHFARIRQAIYAAAEEGAREAAVEDATLSAGRRAKFAGLDEAARRRKAALQSEARATGLDAGDDEAARGATPGLSAEPLQPGQTQAAANSDTAAAVVLSPCGAEGARKAPATRDAVQSSSRVIAPSSVALHEARLVCMLASATGLLLHEEPARRLIAFCKERDELPATGGADSDDDGASTATGPSARTGASERKSRWQFGAGAGPGGLTAADGRRQSAAARQADAAVDWRAHMKERSEMEVAAAREDAARVGLRRDARRGAAGRADPSVCVDGSRPESASGGWDAASMGSSGHISTQSAGGFRYGAGRALGLADADSDWRSRRCGLTGDRPTFSSADAAGGRRSSSSSFTDWASTRMQGYAPPKPAPVPAQHGNSTMRTHPPSAGEPSRSTVPRVPTPAPTPAPKAPPHEPRSESAPPPPSTTSGRRWRVRNLGVRADLVGMGLIQATPLPFALATGGVFRGELELPTQPPAAENPAAPAPPADVLAESLAFPFVSDAPGAVAVRMVPAFLSLPQTPPASTVDADGSVEMQVLVCIKGPEQGYCSASIVVPATEPLAAPASVKLADVAPVGTAGEPIDAASAQAAAGGASAVSAARAPVTLLIVLDKSGSMSDAGKMGALCSTVNFILEQLGPADGVSITAFDHTSATVLPLGMLGTPAALEAAQVAVASLEADGGTDISGGLGRALGCYADEGHPLLQRTGRLTAVLLLTDGQDAGGSSGGDAARLAKHDATIARVSDLGVPIHTFGFGEDHDSAVLHHLASQTGGSFVFVQDASQIADAFAACLKGMQSCVTRDMALDVESATSACRITGVVSAAYTHSIEGEGARARVAFGALYAEERREVLVTVRVSRALRAEIEAAQPAGTPPPALLAARASYTPMLGGLDRVVSRAAILALPVVAEAAGSAGRQPVRLVEVDVARNRELATATLRRVLEMHGAGEQWGAASLLRDTIAALLYSRSVAHPTVMALVDELESLRSNTATSEGLSRGARATALSAISSHSTQRFAGGASAAFSSAASYKIQSQARMLLSTRRPEPGPGGARSTSGVGAATSSAARAVRSLGWGTSRPRSNYDRAMAAEVRLEVQAAPAASVLLTGTITTAWSAVQLLADGSYELSIRRLGVRAGFFAAELPGVVQEEGRGGGSAASSDAVVSGAVDALSADSASLVPGIRVAFGNVLFGGSDGVLLLHAAPGKPRAATTETHTVTTHAEADTTLHVDFDVPVELSLASSALRLGQGGRTLAVLERPAAPMAAPAAGRAAGRLPAVLGLANVAVLMTRVTRVEAATALAEDEVMGDA